MVLLVEVTSVRCTPPINVLLIVSAGTLEVQIGSPDLLCCQERLSSERLQCHPSAFNVILSAFNVILSVSEGSQVRIGSPDLLCCQVIEYCQGYYTQEE